LQQMDNKMILRGTNCKVSRFHYEVRKYLIMATSGVAAEFLNHSENLSWQGYRTGIDKNPLILQLNSMPDRISN